jgi:hypothetical protein
MNDTIKSILLYNYLWENYLLKIFYIINNNQTRFFFQNYFMLVRKARYFVSWEINKNIWNSLTKLVWEGIELVYLKSF